MAGQFRARNTISGKEGRLFKDGVELAYVKSFEATLEKAKSQVPVMGRRMIGNKSNGVSGAGTMVLYKVTSEFTQMMVDYVRTGVDPYFTLQSVLDDQASGRGVERVTLYDVSIDSVRIGNLDVESDALEEEIAFTYEDVDLPESLRNTFD